MIKKSHIITLIITLYIVKQCILTSLIPSWEAPDEPGHVGYISYLYNEKKLPSSFTNFITTSIYESTFLKQHNASFDLDDRRYTSTINVGSHPPLYYLIELVPYWIATMAPTSFTLVILRLSNIAIGAFILYVIYRFTRTILKNTNVALFVAFLVSLQPMFSFITAIVNSDALVMLCYLSVSFLGWRILYEKKSTKKRWFLFLAVAALSPLSKPHLAIVIGIVTYVVWVASRSLVKTISSVAFTALPFTLWLTYNIAAYGSTFWGYVVMNQKPVQGNILMYPFEFIATKQPVGIWMSFWGLFGWLNVPMPKWIYVLYFVGISFGIWGYGYFKKSNIKIPNYILFVAALYIASILAYDIQYYILSQTLAIQGRYIAVILPILMWFVVVGMLNFSKVIKKIAIVYLTGVFVVGQLLMFITLIDAYKSYFR